MRTKAVSALIATVILVAFTVSAAAIVTSFLTGVVKFQTTSVSSQAVCAQKGALFIDTAMCARVRDNSLVGYWRLESMNTTNHTSDLSGYSNDGKYFGEDFNTGTLTNMNTVGNSTSGWTSNGVNGTKALLFDGVDDYVDAGNGASLNNLSALSISFWMKSNSSGNDVIISKTGAVYGSCGINLGFDIGKLGSIFYSELCNGTVSGAVNTPSNVIYDGNWHYISTSWSSGTGQKLYVDNILKSTGSDMAGTIAVFSNTLKIGGGQEYFFNGTIDEVRIYNRSLSAGEIEAIYRNSTYIRNGLAGYWRFNEGSGSSAYDTHHIATTDNAAGATQIGNALSFDGVNDYVNAGNSSSLNLANNFTIMLWAKLNNFTGYSGDYVGKTLANDPRYGYAFWQVNDGRLVFTTLDIKDYYTTNSYVSVGKWYHLAVVFDSNNTANFYVNGSFQENVTGPNPANLTVGTFQIGAGNNLGQLYSFTNGTIDEVRIYNRSLSADEISQLYQKGLEKFAVDGYFKTIKTSVRNIGSTPLSNFTVFADINGRLYNNNTPLNGGLTLPGGSEPLTLQAYTYYDGPIKTLKVSVLNCPISMSLTNDSTAIGTC